MMYGVVMLSIVWEYFVRMYVINYITLFAKFLVKIHITFVPNYKLLGHIFKHAWSVFWLFENHVEDISINQQCTFKVQWYLQ